MGESVLSPRWERGGRGSMGSIFMEFMIRVLHSTGVGFGMGPSMLHL